MSFRPTIDSSLTGEAHCPLWEALEPVFDDALSTAPLPRGEWEGLKASYITDRKLDWNRDVAAMRSRLPSSFHDIRLGPTEIDLIDFILHYVHGEGLLLIGTRGAGKTSLLHYVEAAIGASGYRPRPILAIINCIKFDPQRACSEFCKAIASELRRLLKNESLVSDTDLPPEAIALAARKLSRQRSVPQASRSLADLIRSARVSEQCSPRLVLVFDNLDQEAPEVAADAVEFARAIRSAGGPNSIVVLRPGSIGGVTERDVARAFADLTIRVQAPATHALVRGIASRVSRALDSRSRDVDSPPRAYGLDLTPAMIGSALERLPEVLTSAERALDAASASDTRLLVKLIRRILCHRTFPGRSLLGMGGVEQFHVIAAMIEGHRLVFRGDDVVPNLLAFDITEGNCEFLLAHRILALLGMTVEFTGTASLYTWLSVFRYEPPTIRTCLRMLHRSLLITAQDREQWEVAGPEPRAFCLTDAGVYWQRYLFSDPDYLSTCILDVPLEHAAVARWFRDPRNVGRAPTFAVRLCSLLEYLADVAAREMRHAVALRDARASSARRKVAECLLKGGLLTGALLTALRTIEVNSVSTVVPDVARMLPEVRKAITQRSGDLQEMKGVLESAIATSRKYPSRPTERTDYQGGWGQCQLSAAPAGDDIVLGLEVSPAVEVRSAVVRVTAQQMGTTYSQAIPATHLPSDDAKFRSSGQKGPLKGGAIISGPGAVNDPAKYHVQVLLGRQSGRDNVGLICCDSYGERLRLRFQPSIFSADYFTISGDLKVPDVKELSKRARDKISTLVLSGQRFDDELIASGLDLACKILTDVGMNRLGALYRTISTLLVESCFDGIPWEWMTLQTPHEVAAELPALGDALRVVRWDTSVGRGIAGVVGLVLGEQLRPLHPIKTVGLNGTGKLSLATPRDLQKAGSKCGTLHIIGHATPDGLELSDRLTLDFENMRAFPPRDVGNVVLSVCEGASGTSSEDATCSVAARLSEYWGCVCWAPLVVLTQDVVENLDSDMRDFKKDTGSTTMDEFMRERRKENALIRLYVRYGLNEFTSRP